MSNFDVSRDITPVDAVAKIEKLGIVRIQDYAPDVSEIKDELMSIYDHMEPNYQFGKAIRTDDPNWDLAQTPKTAAFFNSPWMREIASKYQLTQQACQGALYPESYGFQRELFSTYDFLHDQGTATQGWVHFDKLQRFKFFLNVTDIDEDCGPFQAAIGTHITTKALRAKDPNPASPAKWRFGKYCGDEGVPGPKDDVRTSGLQNHYPEIEYELTPMTGAAGTLLVFDSDVFHKGGNVAEGKNRIVVRGHSW